MNIADTEAHYQGKRILVTGGAGAIGSNLVKKLASLKAEKIWVLDDLSSAQKWNVPSLPNVQFVQGSVLDEVELKRLFFEKPQIVYHLAALFANQNSIDHPETDLLVNGLGTLKILQYAQLSGVERVVYASSGCSIYGSKAPFPLKEEYMSLDLSSPYQITKMLGELYCNFFKNHYNTQVVKARFFNSYGPGEIPGQYRNVIPNFIYWALQGKPLPITGTGEETRDFTYVEDIVDGLLRCGHLPQAVGQEFNLASSKETKIIDLANWINAITQNKGGIQFFERRKWDTKPRLLASVEKAGKIIGYKPSMPFQKGLENTIQWFRDNWNQIHGSASFGPGASAALTKQTEATTTEHKEKKEALVKA